MTVEELIREREAVKPKRSIKHVFPTLDARIAYCGHKRIKFTGGVYKGPTPDICVVCLDIRSGLR